MSQSPQLEPGPEFHEGAITGSSGPPTDSVQFDHVVVPLDGSDFALAAMPTARVLAAMFDAELHTVSVADSDADAARLRALAVAALRVDDGRAAVIAGADVAETIASHVEGLGAGLLCLSTHGRGRLSGALIGSVARSLLQLCPEPFVALGPSADRPGWSPAPNWPGPLTVPRIVACVDGSDTSEGVLPVASSWARALGMSLTIVTVSDGAPAPLRVGRPANRYGASGDASNYISELVTRWQGTAPEVNGNVIIDPVSPAGGIRAYLDLQPAGLVALTTHSRSGIQRLLRGATAASIVHASVAPCLVVPAQ